MRRAAESATADIDGFDARPNGHYPSMNLRRLVLLAGAVVLIAGVIGLLHGCIGSRSHGQSVGCGNAIAADTSGAAQLNNSNPANLPIINQIVPHTDYVAQCQSAAFAASHMVDSRVRSSAWWWSQARSSSATDRARSGLAGFASGNHAQVRRLPAGAILSLTFATTESTRCTARSHSVRRPVWPVVVVGRAQAVRRMTLRRSGHAEAPRLRRSGRRFLHEHRRVGARNRKDAGKSGGRFLEVAASWTYLVSDVR